MVQILAAGVVALAAFLRFLHPAPSRPPHTRVARYRRIVGRTLVLFGLSALVALVLAGRAEAVLVVPDAFRPVQHVVLGWLGIATPAHFPTILFGGGILAGGAVSALVARWRRRAVFTFGKVDLVVPKRRAELGWGVLLSVNAGVSEELFFRLAVPLIVALASGSAALGFVLAAILFGYAHRYQGWVGMAASLVVALLLTGAYLGSGRLWIAMLLHIVIDLNALVLRPVMAGRLLPD